MSIESTSVSNPGLRDNEISSKPGVWSEMQGSATGSKDGQFNSFWDKAFSGAQKLFGIEIASRENLEKDEGPSSDEEVPRKAFEKSLNERPLNVTQVFGNSGFGRLSVSVRRDDFPEINSIDRPIEREFEVSDFDEKRIVELSDESNEQKDELEEGDEDEEGRQKSKSNRARIADVPVFPERLVANNSLNANVENGLIVDNKHDALNLSSIGINSAKQEETMRTLPNTDSSKNTSSVVLSQLKAHDEVSSGGIRRLANDGSSLASSLTDPASKGTRDLVGEKVLLESQKVKREISRSGNQEQSKQANPRIEDQKLVDGDSESLDFDTQKAKQHLSSLLDRGKTSLTQKLGNANYSGVPGSNATGSQSGLGEPLLEKEASLDPSSKNSDTHSQKTGSSKSQSNVQVRPDVGKSQTSAPNAIENPGSELNNSRRTEAQTNGTLNRSIRSLDPKTQSSKIGSSSQVTPVNMSVSNGKVPNFDNVLGTNSQLKGALENPLGKQGVENAIKGNDTVKVSISNSKVHSSQGIQLNGNDNVVSNKSSSATKSQFVSYASKTVEETKEVYTALSKSVDRLVSTKNNTVSIRINFDQGGSMALRVSMDSGQIRTAMQTDLPGLESLIKSSWSEFANEWNQKGLKLKTPQFSNLEGEHSKNENTFSFEQRGNHPKDGSSSESRSSANRGSSNENQRTETEQSASSSEEDSLSADLDTEQELKTYA